MRNGAHDENVNGAERQQTPPVAAGRAGGDAPWPRPGRLHDAALGAWRWLVPFTAVAATAAWLAGALSGRAHGPGRVVLIVLGAGLTFVAAALPLWQHRRASDARADAIAAAEAARVRMRVTLNDALEPLVHVISELAETPMPSKARRRGEAIQFTVNTIAALTDADRVRVCFFRLDLGPPAGFHLDAFTGRAGAPDAPLRPGSRGSDAAMRMLRDGRWVLIDDLARRPAPFTWDHTPEYRTALVGPVNRAGLPIGLVTLDALQPGELARADLGVLRLLAELLGIALTT